MRRILWPLFLLAAVTAFVVVAIPTFTIRPFRPQTASAVAWSYALKRAAPHVTAVAALAVPSPLPLPRAPTTVMPTLNARNRMARTTELRILFFMSVSMAYQPPNKVKAAQ